MLPSTPDARADFGRYRDQRNLHRKLTLECHGGSFDALTAAEFTVLGVEAELTGMREQLDFMRSEGMLTDAQIEAAENCIAWGEALLSLIPKAAA